MIDHLGVKRLLREQLGRDAEEAGKGVVGAPFAQARDVHHRDVPRRPESSNKKCQKQLLKNKHKTIEHTGTAKLIKLNLNNQSLEPKS